MARIVYNGKEESQPKATKYRFKKEFEDAVLVIPGLRGTITKDTLTDSAAELILRKLPHLSHNIELIPTEEPASEEVIEDGEEVIEDGDEQISDIDEVDVKPTSKSKRGGGKNKR